MGLCALSLALVFGGFGGPVAAADHETDGSTSETQHVEGSGEQVGQDQPEPTGGSDEPPVTDTLPKLLTALTGPSPHDSDHEATDQQPGVMSVQNEPMALGESGDEPDVKAAAEKANNADVEGAGNGSDTAGTANDVETTEPEAVVSHSPVTEPTPEPQGTAEKVSPPPIDTPPAEQPAVVQPPAHEETSTEVPLTSMSAEAAPAAPVDAPDFITALAYLFFGLPGVADGAPASTDAGGIGRSLLAGGVHPTAQASLRPGTGTGEWSAMLVAPGDLSASRAFSGMSTPTVEGTAAGGTTEKPESVIAALIPDVVPENVRSVLEHTVGAVLAPFSLVALAALASPGITGLVILCAAGMLVGYRQARAASILRAVGIARFVKSGPLGVVRSNGLIAVHPRASRTVRSLPSRAHDVIEPVA